MLSRKGTSNGKVDEDSDSDASEKVPKKEAKKSSKKELAGKKRKRSDSQVSASSVTKKKRQRTESMNSVKSNGSAKESEGPVTRRKASMDAAEEATKQPAAANKEYTFKRIDATKFTNKIQNQFVDNSFEAKARFGKGGDSYGAWSNSKLHDKKGASFIKEKNKMKNRQSHASGSFNALAVNSIKF